MSCRRDRNRRENCRLKEISYPANSRLAFASLWQAKRADSLHAGRGLSRLTRRALCIGKSELWCRAGQNGRDDRSAPTGYVGASRTGWAAYPGTGNQRRYLIQRPRSELSSRSIYGYRRPDRGRPKAERQEHHDDQRRQPDQLRMDGRFPDWSHSRPVVSALQQNTAVHRLLPG